MKAAIRDDNPVIFLEHKLLYAFKGLVPEDEYVLPLSECDVKREGTDVTVVTSGYMVWHAMVAAEALETEGISVEVVDVRTVAPLDEDTIGRSVRKTGRVVAVAEACEQYGPANEWAMVAVEQAWSQLRGPVIRVAGRNSPVPFANSLENGVWPGTQDVIDAIRASVSGRAPGA